MTMNNSTEIPISMNAGHCNRHDTLASSAIGVSTPREVVVGSSGRYCFMGAPQKASRHSRCNAISETIDARATEPISHQLSGLGPWAAAPMRPIFPQMPEVGERFVGTVVKTTTFGAFISLTPGKDGLLHISQIRRLVGGKRVENVEDVLKVGDKVQVELAEIDPRGKLSLHAVLNEEQLAAEAANNEARESHRAERGAREEGDAPVRERRPRRRRTRTLSEETQD